ncbi:phosphotransferase family protein [Sphingobacterium haloxyli]|uniref:Aminoglycoside phosphotransferase domain-containing protein n=1 Tax=Sphingobacterium haloxyli TaxID=2100533 RepID=A0A2S9J7K8_9SPHI|nr:aminoglycoside phosphotransferase family protein [Sphingobacterium haloxyli]PRD48751.1 hypothetical protein C5745_02070 [Sphingobacterium haloxyli]
MAIRKSIYYWKSDRPHTAANTQASPHDTRMEIEQQLVSYLTMHFGNGDFTITPAGGQGNHITYFLFQDQNKYFVRLENGPERDDYMSVESEIMHQVRDVNVPVPYIHVTDISRTHVPFAIQIMECVEHEDLNMAEKRGDLDTISIAETLGQYVARWQAIRPAKFGLFNPEVLMKDARLEGFHDTYPQYFLLNWNVHLDYLTRSGFIQEAKATELKGLVEDFLPLLQLEEGCLVHKDLALWNVLGENDKISAVIDWDDAVSGDPMDDLALLGCFHSGEVVLSAIRGYEKERILPSNYEQRFWLHLLRNIIFKSVIRVKGNYFDKSELFFLSNPKQKSLKKFTLGRIESAVEGLKGCKSIDEL